MFPSQSGLTLGHFLLFVLIYVISAIVGIALSIYKKNTRLLGLQLAGVAFTFVIASIHL
jgi:hypothetical protein